jgi:hypothetical protein
MNAINWTCKAAKQLRKMDKLQQRTIVEAVGALHAMPHCQNVKALTTIPTATDCAWATIACCSTGMAASGSSRFKK